LSDFGVPDDEMPDSLRSDEGRDPDEGHDLDGLLSGVSFPAGLQPVAQTLDALRAEPMRAELSGEAAARGDFRRIMLGTDMGAAWSADRGDDARTLILPVEAAGVGPRPVQGRHRRQRPPRRGRWQAKALAGVAAAAVAVVGVTALAGTWSGSGSQPAQAGRGLSATSATSPSTPPGSIGVEGNGSKAPASSPSPTAAKQSADGAQVGPSDLCREFYGSGPSLSQMAKVDLMRQLSQLAHGPMHVYSYCLQFLQVYDAGPTDQGNQGGHGMNGLPGHDGNGNGNDQGNSGPGNQQR
jgi:hypothetical protein